MPISPYRSLIGLLLFAAILLASASTAQARSVPVDIRVLTEDGRTLADHRQYTRPIALRSHPRADCFGTGTGGDRTPVRIGGTTALGVLAQASQYAPSLRPILMTDYDFGFPGLGICGIGGPIPEGDFWFMKTDGENPQISGDAAAVRPRGSVLWYLMPFAGCDPNPPYPCASELILRAPSRVKPGQPFAVRVLSRNDQGEIAPAGGVRLSGADGSTDSRGFARISLDRSAVIRATAEGNVPSSATAICVNEDLRRCPTARGMRIMGSQGPDRIVGTPGPDLIRTGPGNNRVNVRAGSRDRVLCGRGTNLVVADRTDVVRGCTRVIRR